MPIGIIINVLSVLIGGVVGTLAGKRFSSEFKAMLTLVFGVCAMGMGISAIVLMTQMPAVILSVVLGTAIGLKFRLGKWIHQGAVLMQKPITRLFEGHHSDLSHEAFMSTLVTVIVLFCASSTGIYGSIDAGMTGDSTILISKSILDFFTAAIFACNLGWVVSFIAIPQLIIFGALSLSAQMIFPLTTPDMILNFKACGGFLLIATGFRMANIKDFPIADMIPAMIIIMPITWLWTDFVMPLLG
ncbi:DUF554 domain-containing protein [Fusibacter paucivorans]|uniref:DUF554 domain-containing protein n=1 Tax=Fusibacter paucivorans TaxID=76009 RepID=A0ABS5PR83_9FIRM|nr:DUF554 domain-containing protein [Fusibacter paucivorans]MBS7527664.1 DUF554 domain-containing protein [Fusibacter paucivorans]